jgi:NAD(P)-dependent dehydrogenase (short-subunit alcohol dehydrogenase family)
MGRLDKNIVVITGGASGIGKAAVKLFVKEGAKVVFGDVQDKPSEKLVDEFGQDVLFKHTDVSEEADVQALIAAAVDKFGRLDCIFNNAAISGASGMIDEIPTIMFDGMLAVNLRSVFLGMKYAAAVMKEQMSGNIINTASIAGHRTGFGSHPYSACKAAIIQMTKTVANELGPFNIRTNCICPGAVVTSIFGRGIGLSQEETESRYGGLGEIFKDMQSIPRPCVPEDIAEAAVWLASEGSSYVNGAAINVDGGVPDGFQARAGMREKLGAALGVEITTPERQ